MPGTKPALNVNMHCKDMRSEAMDNSLLVDTSKTVSTALIRLAEQAYAMLSKSES